MHKKKRGQVTIYIILGIIILFSAIIFFYFRNTSEKEIGIQESIISQRIPKEARPITNYVTTQLDDATKKGLFLIGRQGGYIYASQGVPNIHDPTEQGKDFISYDENQDIHNVSYLILKQENDFFNYYFHEPKYYPWYFYPYSHYPTSTDKGFFGGYFGVTNLLPLESNDTVTISIQSELDDFITNYLKEKINLTIFEKQGFEINDKKDQMNISVIIGKNDVIVLLDYPIGIRKNTFGEAINVSLFYSNPQVRLRKIYDLAKDIINKDSTDVLFNIDAPENDLNQMTIKKEESQFEQDDIIKITDNKSMIYAEHYIFQFARKNRYPALRYIPLPSNVFGGNEAVVGAKITKSIINPKGDDPDEDVTIFVYNPQLPYSVKQSDFDRGYAEINVSVKEEGNPSFYDWQLLQIIVSGESEATY